LRYFVSYCEIFGCLWLFMLKVGFVLDFVFLLHNLLVVLWFIYFIVAWFGFANGLLFYLCLPLYCSYWSRVFPLVLISILFCFVLFCLFVGVLLWQFKSLPRQSRSFWFSFRLVYHKFCLVGLLFLFNLFPLRIFY